MSSRDHILKKIKSNQPSFISLPEINFSGSQHEIIETFSSTLKNIGGEIYKIKSVKEAKEILIKKFPEARRIISVSEGFNEIAETFKSGQPRELHNTDIVILRSSLGIAENGSVWLSEEDIRERVLPFICLHLAVIIDSNNIVPGMHEAYRKIGNSDYGFSVFIAGPSKTADIEQSLVMGAHGPASMTVFITDAL